MNIIVILSDTFRYDNLFGRAEMPVRTPNLEAFSKRAVSTSNFYTGSFPTIPHRTDFTSGRCGWPWYPWQALDASTKNHLPVILGQAGYVSQLICDCPHLFKAGFNNGFSAAVALRGQEGDINFLRMNHEIAGAMPTEKTRAGKHFQGKTLADIHRWQNRDWQGEEDRFAPRTAGMAVRWLEENYKHHPFFLWVDLFDPHEPWDPPEYMVRRYDPDYTGCPMIHPNYGRADDLTPEELRNLRAHYCAEAELVDRWAGRILQKIEDLGLFDNSIVLFTTDHGMSLGEHNRTGKSNINERDGRHWPIYPEVAHIPMMIAAPDLAKGRTLDNLLQPEDIFPTFMDLAGLNIETPEPLHGVSFAPLLRDETMKGGRDVAITASFVRAVGGKFLPRTTTPVVYTPEWAYVPVGAEGRPELYDNRQDPLASTDIASKHVDVIRDLHARMIARFREMNVPEETLAIFTSMNLS